MGDTVRRRSNAYNIKPQKGRPLLDDSSDLNETSPTEHQRIPTIYSSWRVLRDLHLVVSQAQTGRSGDCCRYRKSRDFLSFPRIDIILAFFRTGTRMHAARPWRCWYRCVSVLVGVFSLRYLSIRDSIFVDSYGVMCTPQAPINMILHYGATQPTIYEALKLSSSP